jgi:hypothetical protein
MCHRLAGLVSGKPTPRGKPEMADRSGMGAENVRRYCPTGGIAGRCPEMPILDDVRQNSFRHKSVDLDSFFWFHHLIFRKEVPIS